MSFKVRSQQLGSRTVIVRADGLARLPTIYEGQAADESLLMERHGGSFGAPSRVDSDNATTVAHIGECNRCQREHYQATGAMRYGGR
jgi:hypothetical protein